MTDDGVALTILSVNLDASDVVLNENRYNDPPNAGNRFVMARVRVQNVGGYTNRENIAASSFGLVGSSGVEFSTFERSCGVIPDWLYAELFPGDVYEGNVCFQIRESETDLVLFYPLVTFDESERRWLTFANPDSVEAPRSMESPLEPSPMVTPTPLPLGYNQAAPAPAGSTVVTSDGLELSIVSVNLNAVADVLNENRYNDPPNAGNRFVMARVRVQNVGGYGNREFIFASIFGLVGSSGVEFSTFERSCGVIPDELSAELFPGDVYEGNVCFQIRESETDLILFYPRVAFDKSERRWLTLANPDSMEAPLEPSPTTTPELMATPSPTHTPEPTATPTPTHTPTPLPLGYSQAAPAPAGSTVVTGDGLELTIVSVNLDAASIVINENPLFNDPPDAGKRFVMARVRVHNVGGDANSEIDLSDFEFALVGSSAVKFSWFEHSCGLLIPDRLNVSLFPSGISEGNVCFEIPQSETDLILIYEPLSFDAADRRWMKLIP